MDGVLTGQQVFTEDAQPRTSIKDALAYAVRSYVDLEVARETRLVGDAATVNATGTAIQPSRGLPTIAGVPLSASAAAETVAGLKWYHWAGLAVAGGLTYALVTGQFR